MKIGIIAAVDMNWGLGLDGKLPWSVKGDLKRFAVITKAGEQPAVIMGRKTWESMGSKPLPDRVNIVVTSQGVSGEPRLTARSVELALKYARDLGCDVAWGIGGSDIYRDMLPHASIVDLTMIPDIFHCDVLFPFQPLFLGRWVQGQRLGQEAAVVYNGLEVRSCTLHKQVADLSPQQFIERL